MQLQDANKSIENLCNKINCLHDEINCLRMGDQSKTNELREKVTELRFENQSLKGKLELVQMKLDMSSSNPHCFGFTPATNSSTSQHPTHTTHELDPTL